MKNKKTDLFLNELDNGKYSFLKSSGMLDKSILLTFGGSHAYGTNVEGSDVDVRGIFKHTKKEIYSMNYVDEVFEEKETDTVIYPLFKIMKLLLQGNPNCVEIVGSHSDNILYTTPAGQKLIENKNIFLSKRAGYAFGGYASAQLRRLENALIRENNDLSKREQHILNSVKNQMYSFEERYTSLIGGSINLYIDSSIKSGLDTEIFMDIDLKHYPLRDFVGMYSEIKNVVNTYEKNYINHRNNKKDDLHLNKHAMHLVRLLIMGAEILEGKGVNTYRQNDREFLLQIRNGDFVIEKDGQKDYSQVFEIVNKYEDKFNYAFENSSLPENPNYKAAEELLIDINENLY